MAHILIIDDMLQGAQLRQALEREGHDVTLCSDGAQGLARIREDEPDLIISEVDIPSTNGFSLCRIVRFERDTPIMLLSVRPDPLDRMMGLDLGADDYVLKPFHEGELLARVRALLRRGSQPLRKVQREQIIAGSLTVDTHARNVFRDGTLLELTLKEYELLVYLMRNGGIAVSRDELLRQIWGNDTKSEQRTVDVHVRWLRSKIEPDEAALSYIQTVRGFGYRFGIEARSVLISQPQHEPA